ncbi:Origin of replication complex subunit 5 [Raphanus sativus]|uniref:Origin of replication complex subunit 5 n=1 Tax=Raphanus sativus TaxID=3726 RepID=A0A6J0LQM2_RAPSA|nr:origin of replication complex subunit 5 [Raphanus sativus]XP_056846719.1 origin of replication complex subunit 5 [Raphanus sativus]KAJ4885114.1 Origin of replication complex subunit 5 [Raphanus sativus]
MTREESSKVTRRSTRFSSSSVTVENPEPNPSHHPPTVSDLTFGEESITLDALLSNFPGRRSQILDLVRLIGPLDSPALPVIAYGDASTGKTSVVLQVFRHLNRPFVYSSCRTCCTPRILFESILNQLLLHRKCSSNGYASAKRCDKPSDFVNLLREALSNVVETLKSTKLERKSSMGKMVYLVVDHVDLIKDWDKGAMILQFLFGLYSVLKMPQLGIVLISGLSPDVYYSNVGYTDPLPVYFPEYSEEELRQIFLKNQVNKKLYSAFLDVVLRPLCRVTRRVEELSTTFSSLFRKYCEPLDDLAISPNEDLKRRLYSNLKPHITSCLNEIFRVSSRPHDGDTRGERRQKASYSCEKGEQLEMLDFHMSTSAKYLLIAAFLASRNPATLDASMFDSTGGMDNRKRKRKASEKSMEKKEMAEQEAVMKGPGSFPLERLLAIFQCIASVGDSSFGDDAEEEGEEEATGYDKESNNMMSDILLQVSSLCDANFIIKSGSCPLEGSIRYRSMVSEDLSLKVARSLSFPLSKYLYRR